MRVLVIGYGKFGKIKADIWCSLGFNVVVHDNDTARLQAAVVDGHYKFTSEAGTEKLIVDISTPALKHLEALQWVLRNVTTQPHVILVEKPIVSSQKEATLLRTMLKLVHPYALAPIIAVNETYYFSTAVDHLVQDIKDNGATIESIAVDLSKNRLIDVAAGRFTDPELGALGIEVPHIIALLLKFGCSTSELMALTGVKQYFDNSSEANEGVVFSGHCNGMNIYAQSFLGDFRIDSSGERTSNISISRSVMIRTDKAIYMVEFDPVEGLQRYHSRYVKTSLEGREIERLELADDHLRAHLKHLAGPRVLPAVAWLRAENAFDIADIILQYRQRCEYISISQHSDLKINKS